MFVALINYLIFFTKIIIKYNFIVSWTKINNLQNLGIEMILNIFEF